MEKKDRLEVYKKALEIYKSRKTVRFGLCYIIDYAQVHLFDQVNNSAFGTGMKKFPEIYKHKTTHGRNGAYWFPQHTRYGESKRIWILRQAIKELS